MSTISNVAAREVVAYYNAFHADDARNLARTQKIIDQLYHLLAQSGIIELCLRQERHGSTGQAGRFMPPASPDGGRRANGRHQGLDHTDLCGIRRPLPTHYDLSRLDAVKRC